MRYQKSRTQKAFLQVAERQPVTYVHPGKFETGETFYTVRPGALGRFLYRLSGVMSFADYDRLTRQVWVAHMRAERPRDLFHPE